MCIVIPAHLQTPANPIKHTSVGRSASRTRGALMSICISNPFSLSPVSPSSRSRSSVVVLPEHSFILRFPSTNAYSSFSTFSAKTIFSNTSLEPLRAAIQQKYVYPDPIPEFADDEIRKFKGELRKKLSKNKESFGGELDEVVTVCAGIFSDFLHKEYGGPGTLLVEPFTDMLVALKEKKLPGAPEAARAALLWAQNYLDKDWELWTSREP